MWAKKVLTTGTEMAEKSSFGAHILPPCSFPFYLPLSQLRNDVIFDTFSHHL